MNTQDKLYLAYIELETPHKIMVKAENFDHAIAKIKEEYPNQEISYLSLEKNLNLI